MVSGRLKSMLLHHHFKAPNAVWNITRQTFGNYLNGGQRVLTIFEILTTNITTAIKVIKTTKNMRPKKRLNLVKHFLFKH